MIESWRLQKKIDICQAELDGWLTRNQKMDEFRQRFLLRPHETSKEEAIKLLFMISSVPSCSYQLLHMVPSTFLLSRMGSWLSGMRPLGVTLSENNLRRRPVVAISHVPLLYGVQ